MYKKIRMAAAVLFLTLFLAAAIDFYGLIPASVKKLFLTLQFVPSILHFIQTPVLLCGGFVLILIITLLTGRLYCSTICPLGIYQDIVIRINRSLKRKPKFREEKNYRKTRYFLVSVVIITALCGNMFLLSLLDPYSIAGRITNSFIQPVFIYSNNILSGFLAKYNVYSVPPFEYKVHPLLTYIIPGIFLLFITALSVFKGRLFCTMLCPVGTVLGLFSRFSIFKLKIDKSGCKGCGVCEWACKAGCIDSKSQLIDHERCVMCYNCIDACPKGVILYRNISEANTSEQKKKGGGITRRGFLGMTSGLLTTGLMAQTQVKVYKENTVPVNKKVPVSPPGAQSVNRFKSTCTACEQCVSQCPTGVLQPSVNEYGWIGIGQPVMNFKYHYCNYECVVCTEVCPSGALLPLSSSKKKLTQIGRVKFIQANCVVETQRTECGACSEHCPTKAVNMVPYFNLKIPQTKPEICIGCGACEHACPTIPYKAIYVEGNEVHAVAQKVVSDDVKQKTDVPQDFPF